LCRRGFRRFGFASLIIQAKAAARLLRLLATDPFQSPPSFEKLVGNLSGFYSRRINIQHRMVYAVDRTSRTVHVLRMWSHYE